jgi:glutaredoxin
MSFTVYTKGGCGYCDKVKAHLKSKQMSFQEISCDQWLIEGKADFLEKMQTMIGAPWKTFPMVFYNGVFVGGYTESVPFIETKWMEQVAFDSSSTNSF